jgi:hypothetical protein
MTTWNDLAEGSPAIAAAGRRLIERSGIGEGLLATVRGDAPPRIHPVHVRIVDGRLLTFVIVGSAKAGDLGADGRYALHAHQDPAVPHESSSAATRRRSATRVCDPPRPASGRSKSTTATRCTSCRSITPSSASGPAPTTGRRSTPHGGRAATPEPRLSHARRHPPRLMATKRGLNRHRALTPPPAGRILTEPLG